MNEDRGAKTRPQGQLECANPRGSFFFFFFFFYELKLMYICLFTRAKSGREMTDCILSLPLITVTDKHLCNISSKKEEKILQSLR